MPSRPKRCTKILATLMAALLSASALPASVARADAPAAQPAAKKLALLVGIDHYGARHTKDVAFAEQWSPLDGTGNDVKLLRAELERRGFEVVTLLNAQATGAAILQAFQQQLVDKAEPGAVLFFHYSGHGQQIPDDNGSPDEADGYDEALVPYDNRGTKDYSKHIRDDELGRLIAEARKKTDNIVISLDSCHSGTATRGAPGDPKKLRTRGSRPMHPPAERRGEAQDGSGAWVPSGEAKGAGYVFFSAVRADQEANEDADPVSGAPMGAYTMLLVKALADAGPRTTYRELLERIGAQIVVRVSDQNPQAEGDIDKRLFSGEWAAPAKYFRVRPLNGAGELPIEAGSLHGLVPGSELEVMALGTAKGDDFEVSARVKLVRVELGMAYGVAVDDGKRLDAKLFANGAQAREVLTQVQPARLKIAIAAEPQRLQPVVAKLPFAQVLPQKALAAAVPSWDVLITRDAEGALRIQRADGSALPIPRGKNLPMASAVPLDDPNLDLRVSQALEAQFRRGRLMQLENRDEGSNLDIGLHIHRVDAVVERLPSGGMRPKVTQDHGPLVRDGSAEVKAGGIVQLQVENRSTKPCFFTVFELSADGNISVLYPLPNVPGDNKLSAGEKRVLPYPYKMTPPYGTEIIKVIASEDDIDFRALEFKLRAGETRGARSPLERLMGEVMGVKRGEPFGYAPEKLWGTAVFRFEIVAP